MLVTIIYQSSLIYCMYEVMIKASQIISYEEKVDIKNVYEVNKINRKVKFLIVDLKKLKFLIYRLFFLNLSI